MTIYILIITVLVSLIAFQSREIYSRLIFNPYLISRHSEWYRFLSSGFIHADWMHLAMNMFVLYSFGRSTEFYYGAVFEEKGWYYFLILYLGGILIALVPTYKKHRDDSYYNGLGASGAVSAIVFTSILFDPRNTIYLFPGLGIPGILFGVVYLVYSYQMDRKGNDNINHNAHFWGAIYGVVYTIALKPSLVLHFYRQLIDGGN